MKELFFRKQAGGAGSSSNRPVRRISAESDGEEAVAEQPQTQVAGSATLFDAYKDTREQRLNMPLIEVSMTVA